MNEQYIKKNIFDKRKGRSIGATFKSKIKQFFKLEQMLQTKGIE